MSGKSFNSIIDIRKGLPYINVNMNLTFQFYYRYSKNPFNYTINMYVVTFNSIIDIQEITESILEYELSETNFQFYYRYSQSKPSEVTSKINADIPFQFYYRYSAITRRYGESPFTKDLSILL